MNMEQKIGRDRNMGDNLRRLRIEKGISQEKLCAELQLRGCDIGRTTYTKYEAGHRAGNSIKKVAVSRDSHFSY